MGNHRPTTRSKNKRSRTDDNADTTYEIFRKILSNGEVTEDDVNQLYMISKPVCQGCRVNTKDNPNCFCGLIPPPNGSRKSGLWQKTSEIVNSLGPDPFHDLRASSDTPAGLTNLGATCYANSILQCLYMNKSFREGVFSVEPEVLAREPVLNNLVRLFAQLHSSKMAFVDSAPFIQTLELDNGVQQDSHEFLTLLFSLLERCLSQSKVPKARTIVQDLFRGSVSHVTRCSKCGNESEASSKIEDFYELELNVKGLKSLDESLDDYLSIEELQGDNQYYCDMCSTRADATRSIKLRSLPDVLNFQLKRCVFLPNTTTKKKITSVFSFPRELNMARRLSECSQLELIYDLAAVLIHKGSAVNSGHYTAHIRYENTGEWWEFDDEHVSNLGRQPFGSTVLTPVSKAGQNEPVDCSPSAKVADVLVNGNHADATQMQSSDSNGSDHEKTFSSSDAYMLMYVLRHSKIVEKTTAHSSEHKMEIDGFVISQEIDSPLPSHLLKDVDMLNTVHLDSCEKYKLKKEFELSRIMKRRQECLHAKVPVSSTNYMKRLSAEAWTVLHSKYDGGPTLTKGDYCISCIFEMGHNMQRANMYRDRRSLMKELAEAALAGEPLDGKLYYISRSWCSLFKQNTPLGISGLCICLYPTWLLQWLRRKNIDFPCDADSGPTASIRCPHGQLMPELAPGAKRLLVPEGLWDFILQTAMTVKPDDSVGCSAFPSDSEPCAFCSVELTEAAFSEDTLREFKLKQRQNHEKLAMNKSIALYPDTKYYLLPSSWLSKWRSYINASGKNVSSAELDTLNPVVDKLLCKKHCKLLERPPELIWKRELIFQKPSATDGLTLVIEDDWRLLCEEWGGTESKCISATIEIDNCVEDNPENVTMSDEVNIISLSGRPIVKTSPQVCEECVGERESSELMKKLNYTNEEICVCLIHGKEPPKSILEASGSIVDPCRRTSKRSRKATYGNSVNLNVSGSTSVYQLKMMIWESFGLSVHGCHTLAVSDCYDSSPKLNQLVVDNGIERFRKEDKEGRFSGAVPGRFLHRRKCQQDMRAKLSQCRSRSIVVKENQMLHKGSRIIDGETTCLADVNIFPGDILWVTDSKIHENRDIVDELSDPNLDVQKAEEGFRGTLLASTISSQVVSEACLN
ncbi:ubiquitin carboxyl-terminal hydrolase 26 [Phtheirospermum japonicum]|uniref:Ubiquitin carboxyl-terminal hydrolase 26 n=1 Tax=Phtheirospermum japonicum TaxID=374723 RepID=A0A830CRL1_9LAMI|nr:ubiquitin carboxyl-terminal hydrolase 26 [Phtheirospermum japonicum]